MEQLHIERHWLNVWEKSTHAYITGNHYRSVSHTVVAPLFADTYDKDCHCNYDDK